MNTEQAYNRWASNYDTVVNKTRDLEAVALREALTGLIFENALEIGCGTGKNTAWLLENSQKLIAVDFSAEMLEKAKSKILDPKIEFLQMDIRDYWPFANDNFDLTTCSLILEHIQDLDFVFGQAQKVLRPGGHFYLGELHPFKQYQGSKARFETENGTFLLECFTHHVSDFSSSAQKNGFEIKSINEWFDEADGAGVPRILSMVFRKK